jgi:Lhr-like helicase
MGRRSRSSPSTLTDNLIEQRAARTTVVIVGRFRVVNYREHGRTFPTSAPTPFSLAISAATTGHRASHAATQQALLNAVNTHDLHSVLVFHNRIEDSKQWTQQLEGVAEARSLPLRAHHIDGSTPRQ